MTYLDIRNDVINQLKDYYSKAKNKIYIEASAGSFNEDEIRRLFVKTPAIFTCLSSIEDNCKNDESYANFISYVVVQANQRDKLYDNGLLLVGSLIDAIKKLDAKEFGYETNFIKADCLYSGSLDKINACLWAVSFKWKLRSVSIDGEIIDASILENFEGYDATHNIDNEKVNDVIDIK